MLTEEQLQHYFNNLAINRAVDALIHTLIDGTITLTELDLIVEIVKDKFETQQRRQQYEQYIERVRKKYEDTFKA